MRVVICGGGVIGAATAYYLSRRGTEVTVVESNAVAGAASGRSGAFLARDWAAGTVLDPLARRSFDLHVRLLDELEGDWGYHGVTTYGGHVEPGAAVRRNRPADLGWLADDVVVTSVLGTPETTAVMHPAAFTTALMDAARARGAELRHGRVTGVARRATGSAVNGVEVDGEPVGADAVVIALGPWSLLAAEWLPLPPLHPDRGHSLEAGHCPWTRPPSSRIRRSSICCRESANVSPPCSPRPASSSAWPVSAPSPPTCCR